MGRYNEGLTEVLEGYVGCDGFPREADLCKHVGSLFTGSKDMVKLTALKTADHLLD